MRYYAVVRIDAHHQKFRDGAILAALPLETVVNVSIQRGCPEIEFVDADKNKVPGFPSKPMKAKDLDRVFLRERVFTPCGGSTAIDLRVEWNWDGNSNEIADGLQEGLVREYEPAAGAKAKEDNSHITDASKDTVIVVTDGRLRRDADIVTTPLRITAESDGDKVLFERLIEGRFRASFTGALRAYPRNQAMNRLFVDSQPDVSRVDIRAEVLFDIVSEDSLALTAMLENEDDRIQTYAKQLREESAAPWSRRMLPMFRTEKGKRAYEDFVNKMARVRSLQTVLLANPQYSEKTASEAELVTREVYRMGGTRVDLDTVRTLVLSRGGDGRSGVHDRLLKHRPGVGKLVADEVAYQLALPEFRRDGLGLALYVYESLTRHFDAVKLLAKGDPPCDLASRVVPHVEDGCCQGRAAEERVLDRSRGSGSPPNLRWKRRTASLHWSVTPTNRKTLGSPTRSHALVASDLESATSAAHSCPSTILVWHASAQFPPT